MLSSRTPLLAAAFGALTLLAACGGSADTADAVEEGMEDMAADASAMMDETMPAMESFMATLTGENERPEPVTTKAQAEATIMVHADSIVYAVNGLDVMGVTAVHIHRGGAEEAGPVMAALFKSEEGMDVANGSIALGTITRETALPEGVTFDDLKEAVRTGAAYVNIHTKAHPGGELRAQTNGSMM